MLGLPVPQQELVRNEEQARRAARRIGFPVVTKPYNGNHGRGISIRLTTEDEVAAGFHVAREHSSSVIVETFLEGDDHRLLVVNGELVAATRRTPGHVVGDGVHNIVELIEVVNQDPRRGVGHEKVLTRLELDAQAQKMLEKAGLQASSVPEAGQVVYLRSTANLSTGGTATDVTDVIHPDNREMAERAALPIVYLQPFERLDNAVDPEVPLRMLIDKALTSSGLRPVAARGTSPPPGGAGPLLAL